MQTNKKLIKHCKRGSRKAQFKLYERFASTLLGISLRYCRNKEDAEDVLQEAFIDIFKNIGNLEKESSLFPWMKSIVVHKAISHYSAQKKYVNNVSFKPVSLQDEKQVEDLIEKSGYEELLEMIHSLPAGYRTVFNLHAIEGYKHREIAEMLKISEGTSKSQYSRARQMMVEKLKKNHEKEKVQIELITKSG